MKIVTACPELGRNTVRSFAGLVNFERTSQKEWTKAAGFLTQLISTLHPRLLQPVLEKITLTDWTYWVKDVCLPMESLVLLTKGNVLASKNYNFRLASTRLLHAMFAQYANYMRAQREQSKALKYGNESLRRFKFAILNHILSHFPTVEQILLCLNLTIETGEEEQTLLHLEVCLDLILIIFQQNSSFVNQTSLIMQYLELLRPLYASDEELGGNIRIELKAVKTILLLFPKALDPSTKLFQSVLKSFIKAYVQGTEEVRKEAGQLLRGIFRNTGLFESGELEIDLWLQALHHVDAITLKVVTLVFIEVLQVPDVQVEMPKATEHVLNKRKLRQLFSNIEQGLSVEAYVEVLTLSKLMPLIFKGVQLNKHLNRYLELVCLLLFHYHPQPSDVLALYEMEFQTLSGYMRSWLANTENAVPEVLPQEFNMRQLRELQVAVIEGTQFNETLCAFDQDEHLLLLYAQMVLFVVAELTAQQRLTEAQAQAAASWLIGCLKAMEQLDNNLGQADVMLFSASGQDDEHDTPKFLGKMLHYVYAIRLPHIRSVELFSASEAPQLNYLHFLSILTAHCNQLPDFDQYSVNYRLKLIKAVAIALQQPSQVNQLSTQLHESIKLLQCFNLSADNCVEILELCAAQLQHSDFFVAAQPSVYYQLVVSVLQRLAELGSAVNCDLFVRKFCKFYAHWLQSECSVSGELEPLEQAFHDFLCVSQHYIPRVSVKVFEVMFVERKLHKSSIQLACLLLERNNKLHEVLLQQLPSQLEKRELIYPLLRQAFDKQLPIDAALLQRIYQHYKNGFMKSIEKPQKASAIYRAHAACTLQLIAHCMPRSECLDFCRKQLKFDSLEVHQLRVIHAIYSKAGGEEPTNFVNVLVQLLALELKRQQELDLDKLQLSAFLLYDWLRQWQSPQLALDYSKLRASQHWLNFCKSSLKLGMQQSEQPATQALLLKLLAFLCSQVYPDAQQDVEEPADAAQLFNMVCSHSQFHDIVLSVQDTQLKTQLLHLLYTLAKKAPGVLAAQSAQIAYVLGAYQARLSDADRYALALLQLYEQHACAELQQYRPFIWGENAIAFYALRADTEGVELKLTVQETSIMQVMSLIERQQSEYTLDNFPIWRKLNTLQQMPELSFENPDLVALKCGSNSLEQRLELGETEFTSAELRLCPKRAEIYEQCYDPAFMVPLLSMCFGPGMYAHPARPVENGLLAVTLAALAAQDRELRLAAGCAQLRYRAHFEQHRFMARPLWTQFYDNLQAGLNELREAWLQHKQVAETPRVPLISALYVARALLLSNEPTHLLYKQLMQHLQLREAFKFQSVPDFNVLFYSREVDHPQFRHFIVDIIRHGVKSSAELFLLVKTNTLKVLLGCYGSTVCNLELALLLLSLVSTCVKIPASAKLMIEHVGILSWLHTICAAIEFHQFDVIEGLISILNNLWYALRASAQRFHNYAFLKLRLHELTQLLLPHISPRISVTGFAKLLHVWQQTHDRTQHAAITETQLDRLIGCATRHFPDYIHTIENMRAHTAEGATDHAAYCRQLHALHASTDAILALSSLRAYLISWWDYKQTVNDV